jgi:hypothetical protein
VVSVRSRLASRTLDLSPLRRLSNSCLPAQRQVQGGAKKQFLISQILSPPPLLSLVPAMEHRNTDSKLCFSYTYVGSRRGRLWCERIESNDKSHPVAGAAVVSLTRWLEQVGVTPCTAWRWRKKGWLKTINIAGR